MQGTIVLFAVIAVVHYFLWGEFTESNLYLPFILIDLVVAAIIVGILWLLSVGFKKIKNKIKNQQ